MGDGKPTGTVTFLFTDVEGSTRLWEEHPETMKARLADHDSILRSAIEEGGGYIFATGGDGFAAAFAEPEPAVAAATASQLALARLAEGEPAIRARMAIHTGTADERDGDYFGPELNRVARLMAAGHGGQVLVSASTEELTRDSTYADTKLQDLGEHRLKDLFRPVRIYQLEAPGLRSAFPSLRTLDVFSHNLPFQLTSFVGREEEIGELARLIRDSRMVTLSGVGGAGKTRLATQVAAEMLPDFRDGVWLIELAPLTDPALIPSTAAAVLGVQEKPDEPLMDTLTAWLRNRELLLILDNCEHVIDDAARFAGTVLAACSGIKVLATSREILGVAGEHPYQTKSLAAPGPGDEAVEASLLGYPAVRLFTERAELARTGFRITADNAEAVVQIVNRLDGMPLAIELAAARLRMMSPTQVAERLDDRFRLLTGGSRTAVPRQQTLEAAIDWSHDLLTDEEKVLFARLSVFMGGFTLEAAEAVCAGEPLEELAVFDLVGNLVDKSLVRSDEREEGTRYLMLETLRQYALARLAESDEVAEMRTRHAAYFRILVEEAEPHLRSKQEYLWFRKLDEELDNLRQAMGWAVDIGEGELAQATAGALYRYFMYRWKSTEGVTWAESAVGLSDVATVARAKALLAAGTLALQVMDNDKGASYLDEAIALARELDARELLSAALTNRSAAIWRMEGKVEPAEPLQLEALDISRELGMKDGVIILLEGLGNVALHRGDHDLALARAHEALELARELESENLVYLARGQLFTVLRVMGRLEEAAQVMAERRDQIERLGFEPRPGETSFYEALLALDQGQLERAVQLMSDTHQQLTTVPDYETLGGVHQILDQCCRLLALSGKSEVATRLLGANDSLVEGRDQRDSHQLREVEATRTLLKGATDDFAAHYNSGQELSARAALDLMIETLKEMDSSTP